MLTISGLTYRIGGRTLIDQASAQIAEAARSGWSGATAPANRPCWT